MKCESREIYGKFWFIAHFYLNCSKFIQNKIILKIFVEKGVRTGVSVPLRKNLNHSKSTAQIFFGEVQTLLDTPMGQYPLGHPDYSPTCLLGTA